jgi:hypothetical protein
MNVHEIIERVERNCDVRIYVDQFADAEDDFAWYIPEEKAIGINPNISDNDAIVSIVHEVAHHVDISAHPDRRDIDGEVIAHAVEGIIISNEPVEGIISEYEEDIREAYFFNGVVSIDEDDISEVVNQVRAIISN